MRKLTESEKRRKEAAKNICKILSNETSVIAKPLSSVDILNIPNSVESKIRSWIKKYKGKSEIYGSAAISTHSIHARRPSDLDIVIDNPSHAARSLSSLMRDSGIKVKVIPNPTWGSYVVQVQNKKGEFVDALDIHPIEGHYEKFDLYGSSKKPFTKKGITIQRASDQLLRKANAITQRRKDGSLGAPPHRELKDTIDFITTSKLLLSSMEVKSKAELARVKKVRKELKIWETHLAKIRGDKKKKKIIKVKPISETRKRMFVDASIKMSDMNIDDIIFENGEKISVRGRSPIKKVSKRDLTDRQRMYQYGDKYRVTGDDIRKMAKNMFESYI